MTIFRFSILLVLSCVLYTFVFASDSKDSSGTATEAIDALPSLETSDEELILDNGGVKKKPEVISKEKIPDKKPSLEASDSIKAASGKRQKNAAVKSVDSLQGKSSREGQQKPKSDSTPVQKAATSDSVIKAKDESLQIVDEELILDGGEESILGPEKSSLPKSTTAALKDTTRQDSAQEAAAIDSSAPKESAAASDSSGPLITKPVLDSAHARQTGTVAAQTSALSLEKEKKIEKVRAINFAANLKEYRSPKLAMLMSLILPGSGQVYAKSNLVAAGFAVLEAVVIGTGYAFMAKAKDQRKKARAYADSTYNPSQFASYLDSLRGYLESEFGSAKADSLYSTIFFSDSIDEQFFADAQRKTDGYYEDIGNQSSPFVRGWDDVTPPFTKEGGFSGVDTNQYRALTGDTAYLVYSRQHQTVAFGFSSYQERYIDLVEESQGTARIGRNFYMSLLINHITSAVIAGIVAKKHNDELLGRESVWHRIDVQQMAVYTGSHTVNGYAVGVRF